MLENYVSRRHFPKYRVSLREGIVRKSEHWIKTLRNAYEGKEFMIMKKEFLKSISPYERVKRIQMKNSR